MSSILTAPLFGSPEYDDPKMPAYVLPAVLPDSVKTPEDWNVRRAEIMALLEKEEYGKGPALPGKVESRVTLPAGPAFGGKATRQQITIPFPGGEMDVLIYLPVKNPHAPIFWGMNFSGNQSIETDPAIPLARSWVANSKAKEPGDHKARESSRGSEASRWQIETAINAGYGVATAYYGDIYPDFNGPWTEGVQRPASPSLEDGGAVAAWAWGLRLGLTCFEGMPEIDAKRVIVMGHSRLGKAAIWAGATDERFAAVISNDSGECGAALHMRIFGETVARINTNFPHWFCGNFKKYSDRESDLPFDQHFALAAIAPRPLLVTSATEDLWSDPKGEFLSEVAASPVWKLLGQEGISISELPPPDQLINSRVAYLLRTGKHDVTLADWNAYVAFADKHLPKP